MVENAKVTALSVTMKTPQFPGRPAEKACMVNATPVSPETQVPVEANANAVREQTISVSRKVPLIETSACFAG